MKQWHKCIIDDLSSLLHKNFVNFESLYVFLLKMMAPKSHILSACVTRDAYQNSILSSLHAKHSHSHSLCGGWQRASHTAGPQPKFPQRSEAFGLESHSLQCWVFSISCFHNPEDICGVLKMESQSSQNLNWKFFSFTKHMDVEKLSL